MPEEIIGSLRWLADLLGKAWEPKAATAPAGATPIDAALLPTDLATIDPRLVVEAIRPAPRDEAPDHLTAA